MDREATLHHPARVMEKIAENPGTATFILDVSLSAVPGQFAMIWLPGVDEKPFSISAADPLAFTIARVGPFSEALHRLPVGETLWVRGPFGRGFSLGPRRSLLVGGGYGAAPLHFLALALLAASPPPRIAVALGARTSAELLFIEKFGALGLPISASTEDGTAGTRGLVTDVAAPLLASGEFDRVCACGPEGMLEALAALCLRMGVRAELSREAYMRCGVGVCGACERSGRLVCLDGPVFDAREVSL
jgi:dihydroorotate dehydrogenase electron transfer subunit